jgi:hypothetical protein
VVRAVTNWGAEIFRAYWPAWWSRSAGPLNGGRLTAYYPSGVPANGAFRAKVCTHLAYIVAI